MRDGLGSLRGVIWVCSRYSDLFGFTTFVVYAHLVCVTYYNELILKIQNKGSRIAKVILKKHNKAYQISRYATKFDN